MRESARTVRTAWWRAVGALLALVATAATAAPEAPQKQVVHRTVAVVEGFEDPAMAWSTAPGGGFRATLRRVREKPYRGGGCARVDFETVPGRHDTWARFERKLDPPQDWSGSEGLALAVRAAQPATYWFVLQFRDARGRLFAKSLSSMHLPPAWTVKREVFSAFQPPADGGDPKPDLTAVQAVAIEIGPPAGVKNTLWFDEVSRYTREERLPAVFLTTNRPRSHFFTRGEAVELRLRVTEPPGMVSLHARDFADRVVWQREVTVPDEQEVRVPFDPRRLGHFRVTAALASAADEDGAAPDSPDAATVPLAIVPPAPKAAEQTRPASVFGLLGTSATTTPDAGASCEFYPTLGAKWAYFAHWGWNNVEPEPGRWQWQPTPEEARAPLRHGVSQICVLYQTPRWATDAPADDDRFMRYPPKDWGGWERYVRTVVRRWRALMPHPRVYEIWPEPIYPWGWKGTADQLAKAYRLAARAAKEEDPDGVVLGYVDVGPLLSLAQDLFAREVLPLLDGVSTHAYLPADRSPEASGFVENLRQLKLLMRRHGGEKPIWLTEQGWNVCPEGPVDDATQARYLVRAVTLALYEQARAFLFFYLCDYSPKDQPGREDYGMFYNTDPQRVWGPTSVAPRPAAAAYTVMTRMLEGARCLGRMRLTPSGSYGFAFRGRQGPLYVLWREQGRAGTPLRIRGDAVQVTDLMGNTRRLAARAGRVLVPLSPNPVCLRGDVVWQPAGDDGWATPPPQPRLAVTPDVPSASAGGTTAFSVTVRNPTNTWLDVTVQARVPAGVTADPPAARVRLGNYGVATCRFALSVANDVMPGEQVVLLEATTEGRRFAERPVTIRVGK
ncbi:MAG: hypothetical protein GX774_11375 [Armatimonadetes bacterium]|nr:hypothetical protein [Armatimonadota bacterium]